MIEVQGLTKKFKEIMVLNDVNFHVKEGEIFGYLGPNGAGKTTTMRILLGLLKPTTGKALVWGKNLGEDEELRKKVGVLLEDDGLYPRISASENLDYYAQLYGIPSRAQKVANLLQFIGLSDRKNDKVGKFSKGMGRKLALARAIIHDPEVLFLDEPSAGLDPEAQKMVRDLILQLSGEERITIFMNSHDLDEVQRICTNIAILQRGEIKAYDTIDNLKGKFSKPVVEITLPDNREVEKALELLSSLDCVSDCSRHNDGITVTLTESEMSSTLLSFLVEKGVKVEEIKRVSKSLEDVYLEIVHQEERNA
jgi:ABC-2 type transport system ATP-binding protein